VETLREQLARAQRLATLGTVTAMVAHEFNNILTPIISYAQIALSQPDDDALMRKAVEKGLAAAERAAKLSSSILGFATPDDDRCTAPLREVVEESVRCLGREPAKDGIELTIDVPAVALAIEPLTLQQVLLNLLLNARKAMRRTGGAITITAEADGPVVHVHVADTGPGIPDEIRDELFEPFVTHTPGEDDPDEKGTGLGLSICRDLILAAGGSIDVDSAPGRGCTFHITLPLA
jgi:signal transduction histidine kinase